MMGSIDIIFPRLNNLRFWFLPASLFTLLYVIVVLVWLVFSVQCFVYHCCFSVARVLCVVLCISLLFSVWFVLLNVQCCVDHCLFSVWFVLLNVQCSVLCIIVCFQCGLCCSMFSALCSVVQIIVCFECGLCCSMFSVLQIIVCFQCGLCCSMSNVLQNTKH